MSRVDHLIPNFDSLTAEEIELARAHWRAIERRKRFNGMGLTSTGKLKSNRHRPELKGLSGAEYHLAYMRLIRGTKRPRV